MSQRHAVGGCTRQINVCFSRFLFIILVSAFPLHPAAFQPMLASTSATFASASSSSAISYPLSTSTRAFAFAPSPLSHSIPSSSSCSSLGSPPPRHAARGLQLRSTGRQPQNLALQMSSGIFGADDISVKSGAKCFIVGA
eukprot:2709999-Rhodomonas_salina.7